MRPTRRSATIAFIAFVTAIVVACGVIIQALSPRVDGPTKLYKARFGDVSGLVVGNDVRELGVRVGKVVSIDLVASEAGEESSAPAEAEVTFSLQDTSAVHVNSQIAIRYLNLVGQRYLDLRTDGDAGEKSPPDQVIDSSRTIGSFDITEMFNGLRPLFETLDPEALNSLMANLIAVIEGRGADVGSVLGQLRDLAGVVSDRSELIATVVTQLGRVADEIRYKSPQLNDLIARMKEAFGVLADSADKTQVSMRLAARSLGPVRQLLARLEDTYYGNYATVDTLLRKWIPEVTAGGELLARLPSMIDALDRGSRVAAAGEYTCTSGQATPSRLTEVLLAGVPVVVCR